jgi:hypothetical protein
MRYRNCIICEESYDTLSPEKRRVGGLITQCPNCSEEPSVRAIGLCSGDGKQASITIVRLASNKDREAFMRFWKRATGYHKGKECQMDSHLTSPKLSFRTVLQTEATNHKGKL